MGVALVTYSIVFLALVRIEYACVVCPCNGAAMLFQSGEKDPQDIDFKVSHQDIEDENEAKLKQFLESEHEHFIFDDDLKNINRKMRDMLVYIVKMKLGNDEVWLLPTQHIQEYETMKEVCA